MFENQRAGYKLYYNSFFRGRIEQAPRYDRLIVIKLFNYQPKSIYESRSTVS